MHNGIFRGLTATSILGCGLVLVGCGGGGGGSSNIGPPTSNLGGTAAVGTPIFNATVNVVCEAGSPIPSTKTDSSGAWAVTLSGDTLPCAVQVTGGTIDGVQNTTTYQSIAITPGTVNITPLTDLVVANLAGAASPSSWFASLSSNPTQLAGITQTRVDSALTQVGAVLQPLTTLSTANPITTSFSPVSGNALDDMLTILANALNTSGVAYTELLADAALNFSTQPNGLLSALAAAYASFNSGSSGGTSPVTTACTSANFTKASFNAIAVGMSLQQVEQTIGCAYDPVVSHNGLLPTIYAVYQWDYTNLLSNPPILDNITVWLDWTGSVVTANGAGTYKTSFGF
jgi:hypothetical protein